MADDTRICEVELSYYVEVESKGEAAMQAKRYIDSLDNRVLGSSCGTSWYDPESDL